MSAVEDQLNQSYQTAQQQNQALTDQQQLLKNQSDAISAATLAAGRQLTASEQAQIAAAQAPAVARMQAVATARRNGMLLLAGAGLVASVGFLVLVVQQKH